MDILASMIEGDLALPMVAGLIGLCFGSFAALYGVDETARLIDEALARD